MKELDVVALTHDLPVHALRTGDVGTVVHVSGASYEVEFVRADGRTQAVVTLSATDMRPLEGAEILHARKLATNT